MKLKAKPLGAERRAYKDTINKGKWYHIVVTKSPRNQPVKIEQLKGVRDFLRHVGVIDDFTAFHSSHQSDKYIDAHMHIIGRFKGLYGWITRSYPSFNIRFCPLKPSYVLHAIKYIFRNNNDTYLFNEIQEDINYFTYWYDPSSLSDQ